MERDFMGLNSKDSAHVVVKEEVAEGEYARSSGVPWPLSNKVSSRPQFLSLKSEQDEKPAKIKSEFQNFAMAAMNQQFLGWNPILLSNVAAKNEQGINSKDSGVPAQLTIFYGGTLNVFDDISPEKAQAIMFLAGGCLPSTMAQSKLQFQSPPSNMQSPMSVSKTIANKIEQPRIVSSLGSVAATAMISSAVPQSRKASLARFLEKRKERAMSAAPYNLMKKETYCATPESNGFGFSATSGDGSSFASNVKGTNGDI